MELELAAMADALQSEIGLVTVATLRADGRPLLSVVNAGVLRHPVAGHDVVGLVTRGDAAKLGHIRRRPDISVLARRGWQWVGVQGRAELIGPDDPYPGFSAELVPQLLRDIFVAAGGTHDDWPEYDRSMALERRTAVLVTPHRVYGPG